MSSIRPVLEQRGLGEKSVPSSKVAQSLAKMLEDQTPPQQTPPKLALIPLRSDAYLKNTNQQQQKQLEAKQFPIVLGRTNLSQWWYQSCDCQQYYCRLHCRPVAKNIGSLSKVMIQIDTKGTAHIVGKNPHLVKITTPKHGNNYNGNDNTNDAKDNASSTRGDKNIIERKEDTLNKKEEENIEQQQHILHVGDILSIGRHDGEPWMRFQIVNNTTAANAVSSANNNTNDSAGKNLLTTINDGVAREITGAGEVVKKETLREASKQTKPAQKTNRGETKAQPGVVANTTSNPQQRNAHHDAQLPEWITTTTTTNAASRKRSRMSSSYHNYGTTDTKEQQHHQDMVATLTKAAAAAGAAADADERNKSKKHYRYNSYYNYYDVSNNEADSNPVQRKRRRHGTSSFAPYNHGLSSHSNKSVIRSAEDLFRNGSSRRGGRLQGHHNDPQIHLVFQDYETSALLIEAGTRQGRSKLKISKVIDGNGGGSSNSMNKSDELRMMQRKHARTDRNFIGEPKQESMNNSTKTASFTACNANGLFDGGGAHKRQSNSVGLLSKNYAAALLKVSTPSMAASVDKTAIDNMPPPVVLPGDQDLQPQNHR